MCFFHVSSAFDFDNAGETWWHEVEIKFLFGLIYLLSGAEFSIEMIEGLKFAASWSIKVLLIVDSWITVNGVRDFEITSEDDLRQETWKLNGCFVEVITSFVVETESGDGHISIEVGIEIKWELPGDHKDIFILLMHEDLSIELSALRMNSVGNHSWISYIFISLLCGGLRSNFGTLHHHASAA